jgi:hypothetical protein
MDSNRVPKALPQPADEGMGGAKAQSMIQAASAPQMIVMAKALRHRLAGFLFVIAASLLMICSD